MSSGLCIDRSFNFLSFWSLGWVLQYILFLFKGVADGVGGWRHYGIDPGEFSAFLMRTCERLVSSGKFITTEPAGLLARSYYELLESKQPILGTDGLVSQSVSAFCVDEKVRDMLLIERFIITVTVAIIIRIFIVVVISSQIGQTFAHHFFPFHD